MTWLGRTTRSYNWKPVCATTTTVFGGFRPSPAARWPGAGADRKAGARPDPQAVVPRKDLFELPRDQLHAFQQSGHVPRLFRRGDRPLDVVQHRQQVVHQWQVGVAAIFFDLAGARLR